MKRAVALLTLASAAEAQYAAPADYHPYEAQYHSYPPAQPAAGYDPYHPAQPAAGYDPYQPAQAAPGYQPGASASVHAEASYGAAPAQAGYDPYDPYAPAAPAVDPKEEFDQFWINTELCKAEFDLYECLIDCNGPEYFFDDRRVANCVEKFVTDLCGSIDKKAYYSSRVSISNEGCHVSAYADALLQLDKALNGYEPVLYGSLSHDSWSFSTVKMAIHAVGQFSDCVTDAFFYYLSQCTKSNFLDADAAQCLEERLDSEVCDDFKTEESFSVVELMNLVQNNADEAAKKYLYHHYGAEHFRDVLASLAEGFGEDLNTLHSMEVEFVSNKRLATVDVCPTNYLWMNHGLDDYGIEGIPADCVAFHFPADQPKHLRVDDTLPVLEVDDTMVDEVNLLSEWGDMDPCECFEENVCADDRSPCYTVHGESSCFVTGGEMCDGAVASEDCKDESGAALYYRPLTGDEECPYVPEYTESKKDPFTPKYGISKTCKDHYSLSKALWQLAEFDIGDMCFTINGYEIKFLESGNTENLKYEWIDQGPYPQPDSLEGDSVDDTLLIPDAFAPCYTASWRAQKSCTSHLSEWRMSVECCKSYVTVLNEERPVYKVDYAHQYPAQQAAPAYGYPPQEAAPAYGYPPQEAAPTYGYPPQEAAPDSYHQYAQLLEDGYTPADPYYNDGGYAHAEAGYVPVAPAQPAYGYGEHYDPERYLYTKIVASSSDTGKLIGYVDDEYVPIDNNQEESFLVDKFNEWCKALSEALEEAKRVSEDTDDLEDALLKAKFFAYHPKVEKSYSLQFDLPSVRYKHGYYLGQNEYEKATCDRLDIDLDFTTVVPLIVGECHPQACILSQYVGCLEHPPKEHKQYKTKAPAYPAPAPVNPYHHYRALLASAVGVSASCYAVSGFVAGILVIALAQFALAGRRNSKQEWSSALV